MTGLFWFVQENLNLETLQKQFQIVKSETNTSHVMEYGDMVSSWLIFSVDKSSWIDETFPVNYKSERHHSTLNGAVLSVSSDVGC